jgi:hypothetical protein
MGVRIGHDESIHGSLACGWRQKNLWCAATINAHVKREHRQSARTKHNLLVSVTTMVDFERRDPV